MPQELSNVMNIHLSVSSLVISLAIWIVLELMLRGHYERFGSTPSNRAELAQVFPFILLTTILIISVVKSSLALSLGLVGEIDLRRFDMRKPFLEATCLLAISSPSDLSERIDELRRRFASAGVSFLDQNQQPSA
jgi:cytochrome bd-type quinol oxidase subunit 2